MAKFCAGGLTGAGSTTLPIASMYAATTVQPRILEIGIWNTHATTAVAVKLVRLTTAGTVGTGLTEATLDPANPEAALTTTFLTHSVAPTLGNDMGYRAHLIAGAGVVWTWADDEFKIPATANAGLGIIVENGTGQACQVYFKWAE